MFSNLPRLFFPLLGRVTQTAAQGVELHFLPSKNQREVWQKKRGKLGRLFDMQWAWQNDSIRTSNDNLPAVRSLPKSITEGENKLKVVMASGVLSQAINLSFVNTLVRRKKKTLCLYWTSITCRQQTQTHPTLVLLHADKGDLQYRNGSGCYCERYRLQSIWGIWAVQLWIFQTQNAQHSIILETDQTKNPIRKFN